MSNSSMLNGLPNWARAIAVVGFPTLVALYLLLSVTGAIPSALSAEHESIREILREGQQNLTKEQQQVRETLERQNREQSSILRLICSNTATSEAAKVECLRGR